MIGDRPLRPCSHGLRFGDFILRKVLKIHKQRIDSDRTATLGVLLWQLTVETDCVVGRIIKAGVLL